MEKITSRAVLGELKRAMAAMGPIGWVPKISNLFTSDQASEEYPWLSAVPALREWVGGRNAKGFKESSIEIKNKHFEATLEILVRDLRRDKLSILRARINELVRRAITHPEKMLSTLILNGAASDCYDGQFFFDDDHEEGDSGAQSNDISIDISTLAVASGGATAAVMNPAQAQLCIAKAIEAIISFKDSAGEPMNTDATGFLVMVPTVLGFAFKTAIATSGQVAESQTVLDEYKREFNIEVVTNPRLTWTANFGVFRTDSYIKPLIFQRETGINIGAKAEGSEFEFDNDAHQYGVDYWGNCDYGLWQNACLVTLA